MVLIISPARAKRPGSNLPARSSIWRPIGSAKKPQVVPIRTADYPTPAIRAADTRFDCTAIIRTFSIELRPWRQALAETIDRLLRNKDIA